MDAGRAAYYPIDYRDDVLNNVITTIRSLSEKNPVCQINVRGTEFECDVNTGLVTALNVTVGSVTMLSPTALVDRDKPVVEQAIATLAKVELLVRMQNLDDPRIQDIIKKHHPDLSDITKQVGDVDTTIVALIQLTKPKFLFGLSMFSPKRPANDPEFPTFNKEAQTVLKALEQREMPITCLNDVNELLSKQQGIQERLNVRK